MMYTERITKRRIHRATYIEKHTRKIVQRDILGKTYGVTYTDFIYAKIITDGKIGEKI